MLASFCSTSTQVTQAICSISGAFSKAGPFRSSCWLMVTCFHMLVGKPEACSHDMRDFTGAGEPQDFSRDAGKAVPAAAATGGEDLAHLFTSEFLRLSFAVQMHSYRVYTGQMK